MANQDQNEHRLSLSQRSDDDRASTLVSKVPQVTLAFWIIKIFATTVGETGGDALSMSLQLGYAVSSLIFLVLFSITLAAQVTSKRYHPFTYWAVVIATTTVGTTMSDYLDRTLGLGYVISSIVLFCGVLAVLFAWYRTTGAIEFENIRTRQSETFYWVTILVSNTLGTALGDFAATDLGLGFERGAIMFSGLLALVILAHFFTNIKSSLLFWSAYILTRPLGATLGDTLTKSHADGGFALDRIGASLTILALMIVGIFLTSRRAKQFSDSREKA
ncbi:MAG: hypothetical protein LH702_26700 [Phormidesmis sp. CAN_BIN44]|nr:hypothetical protein [Phormidesmis sp. CAN_BIN44]